jgi:three-Cys-motif partner protein
MGGLQQFGGKWTEEKLKLIRSYLFSYQQALKCQPFRKLYIDAFAGTGYRESKDNDADEILLFPELAKGEGKALLDGSASIALQIEPPFDEYIFVENKRARFRELEKLRTKFPQRGDGITLVKGNCEEYLRRFCEKSNWRKQRAVLFLDPYGMQVTWETVESIAATRAIDMWWLFPLGIGVNRLLRRDGNVPDAWSRKLTSIFGTEAWRKEFYRTSPQGDLFKTDSESEKIATFDAIAEFTLKRLESVFAGVAKNPIRFHNSSNNPLYLLCFAAGNPSGASLALRLAQHILQRRG